MLFQFASSVGRESSFWNRNFFFRFSVIKLHFFSVFCMSFWYLSLGFLENKRKFLCRHKCMYLFRIFGRLCNSYSFAFVSLNYYCNVVQYTFLIITRSFLLRVRNVSDKRSWENRNTYFILSNIFFSKIVLFMRYCENIL